MKINAFEGARRITLLVAVLWTLGWVAYGVFNSPSFKIYLSVDHFNATPLLTTEQCNLGDATEYVPKSNEILGYTIEFCFRGGKGTNGESLIPYAKAEGALEYVGQTYSENVRNYTKNFAANYAPTREVLDAYSKRLSKVRWENIVEAVQVLLGGLVFLWLFSWSVGWIVRGFMGIPKGKDIRPDSSVK